MERTSAPAIRRCLWLTVFIAACTSLPEDHSPGRVNRLPSEEAARIAPPPTLTLDDIIALQRSATPAETIVRRIRESGTAFRLTTADILRLNRAQVPDNVIDFMLNTERSAAQESCAGEMARRDREYEARLARRDQDWAFRCNAIYPPFYSPFFPHRHFWWR